MTTPHKNLEAVGQCGFYPNAHARSVEALLETINHPEQSGTEIHVPTHLVTLGSTALPRYLLPDGL